MKQLKYVIGDYVETKYNGKGMIVLYAKDAENNKEYDYLIMLENKSACYYNKKGNENGKKNCRFFMESEIINTICHTFIEDEQITYEIY